MIKLTGKYNLPNWDITFTDPTIKDIIASDNIGKKTCDVSVVIEVAGAKTNYGYSIGTYTYGDTWEDSDIETFVQEQMAKHKKT